MPAFKIVDNTCNVTLSNEWVLPTQFNSKDLHYDADGKAVGLD